MDLTGWDFADPKDPREVDSWESFSLLFTAFTTSRSFFWGLQLIHSDAGKLKLDVQSKKQS